MLLSSIVDPFELVQNNPSARQKLIYYVYTPEAELHVWQFPDKTEHTSAACKQHM